MGCHSLLQGIFLTQKLNPGFPHCMQILCHVRYRGSLRSYVRDCFIKSLIIHAFSQKKSSENCSSVFFLWTLSNTRVHMFVRVILEKVKLLLSSKCMCSVISNSATPWTVPRQAPLMEFSRQEYWSRLPYLLPGDLPDPGIETVSLASPALAGRFFTTGLLGKPILSSQILGNKS